MFIKCVDCICTDVQYQVEFSFFSKKCDPDSKNTVKEKQNKGILGGGCLNMMSKIYSIAKFRQNVKYNRLLHNTIVFVEIYLKNTISFTI